MNLPTERDNKAVIQKLTGQPLQPSDRPSAWKKFWSELRQVVGFRSLPLGERWTTAKVEQEEMKVHVTMLEGKANYEKTMAEAARLLAEARKTDAETELISSKSKLLQHFLEARKNPEEAKAWLEETMSKIKIANGVIDFGFKELTDETDSEQNKE